MKARISEIVFDLPFMDPRESIEVQVREVFVDSSIFGRESAQAKSSRVRTRSIGGAFDNRIDRRKDASRRASKVRTYFLSSEEQISAGV